MHSPMTETDGMWKVRIQVANSDLERGDVFHTREQASQWICKKLQSMLLKDRAAVTGYTIDFQVLGRATTSVPGLPGSYQAVQEVPKPTQTVDPNTNCCEDFARAKEPCTDKEDYGAAVFECGGEWHIGSEDIPALRFCPWCGAAKAGGAS